MKIKTLLLPLIAIALASCGKKSDSGALELHNVSYDPTREFYDEVNVAFAKKWAADGKGGI